MDVADQIPLAATLAQDEFPGRFARVGIAASQKNVGSRLKEAIGDHQSNATRSSRDQYILPSDVE